ncbi:MAG: DNA metabolism protein [Clostridia bacterium]|jgi:probable DNA metabolism protein|nr:DNA metabolism protein [Clostridia bacterium]
MLDFKILENVAYLYDGSFNGLLTIVFDCYLKKVIPSTILPKEYYVANLLEKSYFISTNEEKSNRIWHGISANISFTALYDCYHAFLSCQKQKDLAIVNYLLHGFKVGPSICHRLTLDYVLQVTKLRKRVFGEAHRLKGLVRLSEIGNNLWYSSISPDNNVIEQVGHFLIERFPTQNLILHDKNRNLAFLYTSKNRKNYEILEVPADFKVTSFSEEEKQFQKLWKTFFETIAIDERKNTRLQMQFMPKKYWKDLVEMN